MIERFTPEELEIIKKELGVNRTAGSKKSICSNQFRRIKKMFPRVGHAIYADKNVWESVCCLCDHTLQNYDKGGKKPVSNMCKEFQWRRYSSIFQKEEYKSLIDELLDVLEKHIKKESDNA